MLVSKKQPVFAARTRRFSLLQEAAERGDSCSRSDHDHRPRAIEGRSEMGIRMHEHGQRRILDAICKKRGANALALASMCHISNNTHGEMHAVRMRLWAGGNGIEPRLQGAETFEKVICLQLDTDTLQQQIDDAASKG